jgi:hypothetical protein
MTRSICAVLFLAVLPGHLLAADAGPPPPGSTPSNPLPAWGNVEIGCTFNFGMDSNLTIVAYAWGPGDVPYVQIYDSVNGRCFIVSMDGKEYYDFYVMNGVWNRGYKITWDPTTNTICIKLMPSSFLGGWTTTYYGPIPLDQIP